MPLYSSFLAMLKHPTRLCHRSDGSWVHVCPPKEVRSNFIFGLVGVYRHSDHARLRRVAGGELHPQISHLGRGARVPVRVEKVPKHRPPTRGGRLVVPADFVGVDAGHRVHACLALRNLQAQARVRHVIIRGVTYMRCSALDDLIGREGFSREKGNPHIKKELQGPSLLISSYAVFERKGIRLDFPIG